MADDMGYSDLGCYGGEISTPNLDGLAEDGMRFTQFYNSARSCPTRASLLTGLYPHQAGVGRMTFDAGQPGYRGELSENAVTLAEVLKKEGYKTAMTGKWHLSLTQSHPEDHMKWLNHQIDKERPFSNVSTYPVNRGFDKFYGIIWGVADFFDPFSLVEGTEPVQSVPEDYYITDAISSHSVKYIEEFTAEEDPFFMYVSYTAPHWPLHALPGDIEKYKDTYKVGWEKIQKARYQRMLDKGLIREEGAYAAQLPDRKSTLGDEAISWEENEHKKWDARAMAVHAAMIDRMDRGIGTIIDKLKEKGELDNTLILFLSDNGASSERPSKYGPGFDRPSQTRDGKQIHYPVDKDTAHMPGPQTVMAGIGPKWSNVANTPFRYWKGESFEGGACTPFIAHWPSRIGDQQGAITHQTGHITDIMATCLDVSGAVYPEVFQGDSIIPLEGKSLMPVFEGKSGNRSEVFYEHMSGAGYRMGDWKIVKHSGEKLNSFDDASWHLFDLSNDRTERTDVSESHPERFQKMKSEWERRAKELKVFPLPQ